LTFRFPKSATVPVDVLSDQVELRHCAVLVWAAPQEVHRRALGWRDQVRPDLRLKSDVVDCVVQ
jgi:hypothetical protein